MQDALAHRLATTWSPSFVRILMSRPGEWSALRTSVHVDATRVYVDVGRSTANRSRRSPVRRSSREGSR